MVAKVPASDEREFASEVEKCLATGAYRSAIVVGWNLAYQHLRSWLLRDPQLTIFNGLLTAKWKDKKAGKKHDAVLKKADLDDHKERFIIDLCKEANLIRDAEYRSLDHGLDKRNQYAHPSGAKIDSAIAAGHVQDLMMHIVLEQKFS